MSDYQSSALMVRRRPEVDIARSMERFVADAADIEKKTTGAEWRQQETTGAEWERRRRTTRPDIGWAAPRPGRRHRPTEYPQTGGPAVPFPEGAPPHMAGERPLASRQRKQTLPRGVKVKGWTHPDVEKAALGTALRAVGRGVVSAGRGVARATPRVLGATGAALRTTGRVAGGAARFGLQSVKETARGAREGWRYVGAAMQPRTVASAGRLIAPIDPTRAVGGAVAGAARHILKPTKQIASAAAVPKVPKSAKTKAGIRAARGVKPAAAPETPAPKTPASTPKVPGGRKSAKTTAAMRRAGAALTWWTRPKGPMKPAVAARGAPSTPVHPSATPRKGPPSSPPTRAQTAAKRAAKAPVAPKGWVSPSLGMSGPAKPAAAAKPSRPRNPPLRYKKPGAAKQPGLPLSLKSDWSGAVWVDAAMFAKSIKPGTSVTLWQKPFRVHSYDAQARKYRLTPEKKIPNISAVKVHERQLGVPDPATRVRSIGVSSARRYAHEAVRTAQDARRAARPTVPGRTVKGWLPSSPTRRAVGGRAADILARRKRERRADVSDAVTRRERRQGARATAQAEAREADYARAARKTAKSASILDRLDVALVRAEAREAVLGDLRRVEMEKARAEMQAEAARPANESVTVEKNGATVTLRRADTLAYRPEDVGRGC